MKIKDIKLLEIFETLKTKLIFVKNIERDTTNNNYSVVFNKTSKVTIENINKEIIDVLSKYTDISNIKAFQYRIFKTVNLNNKISVNDAVSNINHLFKEDVTKKINDVLYELVLLDKKIMSLEDNIEVRKLELKEIVDKVINLLLKPSLQKKKETIQVLLRKYNQLLNNVVLISKLEEKLQFSNYQNTFIGARNLNRKIKIFVGPTNSGKTYSAFERLKKVDKGSYLAPLRLLAHEGAEKLFERGVLSDILTGEERKIIENSTHVCSTIEMAQLSKEFDCVVIDEIQMLLDKQRGWAWTQALVGMKTKELILVGSDEVLPMLLTLLNELNEGYEITRFERKNELVVIPPLNDVRNLKKGDCLVVFSRKDALYYKEELKKEGRNCSVIYGNLSPELRVSEARKFNSGKTDILIATDAIGMGLNLPIKRIFFSKLTKYNGIDTVPVEDSLIKQIAGRAGRFGFVDEPGCVSTLEQFELASLKNALNSKNTVLPNEKFYIQPNVFHIEEICKELNTEQIKTGLIFFREKMVNPESKFFKPSNLDDIIELSMIVDTYQLSIKDAYILSTAPVDRKNDHLIGVYKYWLNCFKNNQEIKCPKIPYNFSAKNMTNNSLFEAENYIKMLNLYKWLNNKYELFNDLETVNKNMSIVIKEIEKSLETALKVDVKKKIRYY